jgi:hypothetical protein
MTTHADIVKRSGTDAALADTFGVNSHQVRDWRLRDSIPPERWEAFALKGYATLEELAGAAAAKKFSAERPAAAA